MVIIIYFYLPTVDLPPDVKQAYEALPKSLDYNVDVKPILSDKCFACHEPDKAKQKAGLRLDIAQYTFMTFRLRWVLT
ncbi:c-type cytochrome domain-containing protein [Mucilaginibacter mallensis]|uniref:c-type cytochrome domain-containing protein n=1 Tax=Mucilaginibacter mallensis TaxID=652787 RepID=UPI0018D3BEBA|nr:c-type cytochrome domain-containing protein [Mucilaginibacter mallensis]